MKPTLSVKQVADMTGKIRRAITALTEKDVFIGVPANDDERGDIKKKNHGQHAREGGINNAELSYIHEYGAPAAGIPARPHLVPGLDDIKGEAAGLLKGAAKKALEGNEAAIEPILNKIGLLGEKSVRAKFQDNDWPPLDPEYAHYKAIKKDDKGNAVRDAKGRVLRKKSRWEKATKNGTEGDAANPLLDTAQLMKSHTYVIRKKGKSFVAPGGSS